ncbi:maleylpyruvate isomerase family mycothiol-dependent enzyme [Actinomadura flavalba]|uniref:maleylpyruvate isomerase family mycothiol-dependent enzyme n=1 Tax=Actinomadura flavalba TaxID=1120938 RepID=UPI0003656B43|nr:maleylpyruvate isomerase family mycothiol-dependent enzyme [Actinomadura flavalba]
MEPEALYRRIRDETIEMLARRTTDADRTVPACPEWDVRDVLGHVVDICARATRRLTGGPEPAAVPAGGAPVADLLAKWRRDGALLDRLLATGETRLSRILVMDAFTHWLDLRQCFGLLPPAEHPAYLPMIEVVMGGFSAEVAARDLPPLHVVTDGRDWTAGRGQAAATLSAAPHDLFRTLTGRRTFDQVARLAWSTDPAPWLPALTWGPFTPPARAAEEVVRPG